MAGPVKEFECLLKSLSYCFYCSFSIPCLILAFVSLELMFNERYKISQICNEMQNRLYGL